MRIRIISTSAIFALGLASLGALTAGPAMASTSEVPEAAAIAIQDAAVETLPDVAPVDVPAADAPAPVEVPVEAPAEVAVEVPAPAEVPVVVPAELPVPVPADVPAPAEAPAPADIPAALADVPAAPEAPAASSVELPAIAAPAVESAAEPAAKEPVAKVAAATEEVERSRKIAFCHRTASHWNPYVYLETSVNTFFNSGHVDDIGPIFPDTDEDGDWGDIFPPNRYSSEGQNWTSEGQAIFENDCELPENDEVPPVAPTVEQSVCTDAGTATTPTLSLPDSSDDISYTLSGEVAQGGVATVTATPSDDVDLELADGDGWVLQDDGSATYTVAFDTVHCETPPPVVEATPVAPAVIQAVCTDGKVTVPTLTLAVTTGIGYTVAGAVANGGNVVVTATPQENTVLTETAGWTPDGSGSASLTVTLDKVECPVVTTPPATTPAGKALAVIPTVTTPAALTPAGAAVQSAPLAATGLDAAPSLPIGGLLILLGGVALWRNRRTASKH
ncbi:hypothetical protein [Arthrobacter sp. TWP1-1]|uniref:hypothetical protein n=1 Tax=Arthrobacter sp. TWP1-1 TaxID=2804568 RepID=UPI003CED11D8